MATRPRRPLAALAHSTARPGSTRRSVSIPTCPIRSSPGPSSSNADLGGRRPRSSGLVRSLVSGPGARTLEGLARLLLRSEATASAAGSKASRSARSRWPGRSRPGGSGQARGFSETPGLSRTTSWPCSRRRRPGRRSRRHRRRHPGPATGLSCPGTSPSDCELAELDRLAAIRHRWDAEFVSSIRRARTLPRWRTSPTT